MMLTELFGTTIFTPMEFPKIHLQETMIATKVIFQMEEQCQWQIGDAKIVTQ